MHRSGRTGQGDFGARGDYGLVLKIMHAIECYNRDEHIDPNPHSLRDTMLAVAALLHLEATKIDSMDQPGAAEDGEALRKTFTGAAWCQFDAIIAAAAIIRRDLTGECQ